MDMVNMFFMNSPKVTKLLTLTFLIISLLAWFEVISSFNLYLNLSLVFKKFQIWRIFTSFLFFEEFGVSFLFHLILFYRYSNMLEKNVFKCSSPDYMYFLFLAFVVLLIICPIAGIIRLSSSLSFTMMYYWGRKSKNTLVQFIGIITIRAPYLPWLYLLAAVIFQSDIKNDIIGIIAGHTIFFFKDIFPRIKEVKGKQILQTPNIMKKICNKLNLNNEFVFDVDDGVLLF